MPEFDRESYLWVAFMENGMTAARSNGERSLQVSDLIGYANVIPSLVEPWEFRAVVAMSQGYIRGYNRGTNALGIPPMDDENWSSDKW